MLNMRDEINSAVTVRGATTPQKSRQRLHYSSIFCDRDGIAVTVSVGKQRSDLLKKY